MNDFDSKRLDLYKLWHKYLAETLVHTADEVKLMSECGDLDGIEMRCAELAGLIKALRTNGDAMAEIDPCSVVGH